MSHRMLILTAGSKLKSCGSVARVIVVITLLTVGVAILPACVCTPGPDGYGLSVTVPALPPVVVLDLEPFFFHSGFYYFFQGDRWSYSEHRDGPWRELPRDRYPREIRYRYRDDRGRGDGGGGIERR